MTISNMKFFFAGLYGEKPSVSTDTIVCFRRQYLLGGSLSSRRRGATPHKQVAYSGPRKFVMVETHCFLPSKARSEA